MKNRLFIAAFSCVVILQIFIPLSMIIVRESTLKEGVLFRFKTEPVDPYDAFRGKYVALRVEADKVPQPPDLKVERGQKIYASIGVDKDGFAVVSQITTQKPSKGSYLFASVKYTTGKEVILDLPIDRYYMEEKAAPRAEELYRQHSAQDKKDAYVTVRIKDGFPVVEGLYVGGQKIEDMVKTEKQHR